MRKNQLSARKTTPTRLTLGIQRTKKIVHITCGTYSTARASHNQGRDDTRNLGEPRFHRVTLALVATRSCVKIRLFELDTKYTMLLPKTQQWAGKVMASIFWDAHAIFFIDYLENGKTINSDCYMALLDRLNAESKKKGPHM